MERKWLNETRTDEAGHIVEVLPNENGEFILEIINKAGNRVSTFKGKSMVEVNEKLAEAQVQSNRQLGRLIKPDRGRDAPLKAQPQDISSEDRVRYSAEITDPNRVVEVIDEVVTRRQGVAPATVAQRVSTFDQQAAEAYWSAEANAFVEAHPYYYPTPENQTRLLKELERRGYDITRNNLAIAYEALMEDGVMDVWPNDGPPAPESAAPPATPPKANGSRASGLRSSDASASKPTPAKPKPIITRAELARMSKAEYDERYRDPAFRRAVDALGN